MSQAPSKKKKDSGRQVNHSTEFYADWIRVMKVRVKVGGEVTSGGISYGGVATFPRWYWRVPQRVGWWLHTATASEEPDKGLLHLATLACQS